MFDLLAHPILDYLQSVPKIIHRDIKPENILIKITPAEKYPQAKFSYKWKKLKFLKIKKNILKTFDRSFYLIWAYLAFFEMRMKIKLFK